MDLIRIIGIIEQKIREIENEFQNSQGLILTEDDLKCHLFRKLYDHFDHSMNTMDANIKASPLHAELKYFDSCGALTKRPDLVILRTEKLSILHSVNYESDGVGMKYKQASSKEFELAGASIIFELKFCRNRKGINKSHIDSYEKDIQKIRELQRIADSKSNGANKIVGIIVIFNKTDKKPEVFNRIFCHQNESLKVYYGTGKVDFSANDNYLWRFDKE